MPKLTIDLIRKRSEHNEGYITTLEEISLHQEELEKIELIGTMCRKLKILYLQNNIIPKLEGLEHLKDLDYLNVALNNIKKIEGLSKCEFLRKLDLTVNFIDVDELQCSLEHLVPLKHLRELYMMGNPAQSHWEDGFTDYVIAKVPQLQTLDGKEITKSMRIAALQKLPKLQRALDVLVAEKNNTDVIDVVRGEATDVSSDTQAYTPESRREMYLELAEQKEEQEASQRENQVQERDYELEHEQAIHHAKQKERDEILQCNQGKWDFTMDDESVPGCIILHVDLPKYLDSSLIHVDAHPTYVTIVVKNKTLRLKFPEEVASDNGKAERSKITGALKLTFTMTNPKSIRIAKLLAEHRLKEKQETTQVPVNNKMSNKIGHALLKAVNVKNIVNQNNDHQLDVRAIKTKTTKGEYEYVQQPECDDTPPALF